MYMNWPQSAGPIRASRGCQKGGLVALGGRGQGLGGLVDRVFKVFKVHRRDS
jgi:hypothetical protein